MAPAGFVAVFDAARQCDGKIRYLSEMLARNASFLLSARYPRSRPLDCYRCPHCGDWHLGNTNRRVRHARERQWRAHRRQLARAASG